MTRIETVLTVQKNRKILLGFKNPEKKFGGKWNGFGGGLEKGESLEECAIRETFDETGIITKNLQKRGKILFKFEIDNEPHHEVYFFVTNSYKKDLNNSKDFIKYKWFDIDNIEKIYNQMMPADKYFYPYYVQDKMFKGEVHFNKNFEVIFHDIKEVDNLN